jgi:hypothetical protein
MKKLLGVLTVVVVLSWLSIVGAFTGLFFFDSVGEVAQTEGAEALMFTFVTVTLALTAVLFVGNKVTSGGDSGMTKEQKKAAKLAETTEVKKIKNKRAVILAKKKLEKAEKSFSKVKASYDKAVQIEQGTYVAPAKVKKPLLGGNKILAAIGSKFNFKEQSKIARQRKLERLQRQINGQPEPKVTKAQKIELKKQKKVEKAKAKLTKLTTQPTSVIPVLFRKKEKAVVTPVVAPTPAPVVETPKEVEPTPAPVVAPAPTGTVVNVDPAKGTATVRTSRFDRLRKK